jgi:hypothetical protein
VQFRRHFEAGTNRPKLVALPRFAELAFLYRLFAIVGCCPLMQAAVFGLIALSRCARMSAPKSGSDLMRLRLVEGEDSHD